MNSRLSCLLFLFLLCSPRAPAQDTTWGITWDQTILLSDSNYDAFSPKIALSGEDTVHVIWASGNNPPRLPYRRSVNGGSGFEPTRDLLSDSSLFPTRAAWINIMSQGHRVFVFFNYGSGVGETPVRMTESTDRGESWLAVRNISPDTGGEIRSAAISGDMLGIVYSSRGGVKRILRSTDGGETWTRTNESLDYFARIALSPGVLHLVQLGPVTPLGEAEYRRSSDLGDSWQQTEYLSTVDGFSALDPEIAAGTVNGTERVVAAWRDSKYGCLGWVGCSIIARYGTSSPDSTIWEPEAVITSVPLGYEPKLDFGTNDAAAAWPMDQYSPPFVEVSVLKDGTTWCPPEDPVGVRTRIVAGVDVAITRKAVHVVWYASQAPSPSTFRIFYRRGRFIQTGVGGGEEGIPSTASLGQNYPNPFNPRTTIPYRIDRRTEVTLRVLDLLGRDVATLVSETREPGSYTEDWDGGDAPSGIYFYRLTAGGRVETRKAVLLR